jgi:hypothetical protein
MNEELEQINAAITAILQGGQSYSLQTGGGTRQVTYADYGALAKRKAELEAAVAAASGTLGTRLTSGW